MFEIYVADLTTISGTLLWFLQLQKTWGMEITACHVPGDEQTDTGVGPIVHLTAGLEGATMICLCPLHDHLHVRV